MLFDELFHLKDVPPCFLGNNIDTAASRKGRIQILHRRIKGKIRMAGNPALFRQMPAFPNEVDKVYKRLMLYHNSFGLSRGAGGINHVSKALSGLLIILRGKRWTRFYGLFYRFFRDDHLGLGILQHIGHTAGRIIQIQRNIRPTCLMHAQSRRDEFLGAAHADGHKGIFLKALIHEILGHPVRCLIQFLICHAAVFISNGHSVRIFLCLFAK